MRLAQLLSRHARGTSSIPTYWTIDAERPLATYWSNYAAASVGRFSYTTSPVPSGQAHAIKVDIVDGDLAYISTDFTVNPTIPNSFGGPFGERAELATGNPPGPVSHLFLKGDEIWMAYQMYVPSSFPVGNGLADWQIVTQWKQLGAMGVPAFAMRIQSNQWELWSCSNPDDSLLDQARWTGPMHTDRWVKFSLHVKFDTDPVVGFLELYADLDGNGVVQVLPKTNLITMKNPDAAAGESVSRNQFRIGIYRNPTNTGNYSLYYGKFVVGSTRSIAETAAFT